MRLLASQGTDGPVTSLQAERRSCARKDSGNFVSGQTNREKAMFLTSLSTRASPVFADPRIVSSLTPSQPVYKKLSATGGHAVRLGTTGSYALSVWIRS